MATLKIVTNLVRAQTPVVATHLYSALDSLPSKSALHSNRFLKFSRNFSRDVHFARHTSSTHHDAECSQRLSIGHSLLASSGSHVSARSPSSSSVNTNHPQYICPSRLGQLFSQIVITDNLTDVKSFYDCPVATRITNTEIITPTNRQWEKADVTEPPLRGHRDSPVEKEALQIMRIRHKKMKKHKLKKLRKRMYFLWKKQKATRRAKRDAIYWKEIADIKKQAEDFNAEDFVKDQLEKARKGGFYLTVMGSKSN